MIGCLKLICCFFLGLIYLGFLAAEPGAAIVFGGIALVAYIFWSKNQKEQAEKEAEQRRIRREKERQEKIALARQRQDLYLYTPSKDGIRSTKNIFENPAKWAESIENRYKTAQNRLIDAEIVLNDDIEKLHQYRNYLKNEIIEKYEIAIRPFFQDLSLRDSEIPTPKELKVAIAFTYPSDLQPSSIHKNIASLSQSYSQSITRFLSGKDIRKLQKGDLMTIAIGTAIYGIFHLINESKRRIQLEEVQANVDNMCEEISGAIKTYGRAAEEIKHVKSVHEVAANYVQLHLNTVLHLSTINKNYSELQESERKAIEACYRGGQSLKIIMKKDVVQPITRTN